MNHHKILKKGLVLGVIVTVMLSMLPMGLVFAQDTTITVQVNGLLVYEQPNAASTLLAVMSLGSTLTQVGTEVQNGFNRVRLPDGRQGWAVLSVAGAPAGAAVTTGSGGGTASNVIVRALGNLRIRNEPSLNGSRIGGMGWGDQAYALAVDSTGKWLQINFNGLVGWASLEWFEYVSGSLSTVATSSPATVSASTIPVSSTTTTSSAGVTPVGGGVLIESRGNVRLRSAPSLSSERLGYVPWGAVATLLAFDSTGEWVQLDYNGVVAWSASEWWVVSTGRPVTSPSAGVAASSATTSTSGAAAPSGGQDFILFNAPADTAVAIRVVSAGTPFTVINANAGNGYSHVRLADGTDGFVKSASLSGGTTSTGTTGGTSSTTTTTATGSAVVMSLGNVRLRSAPSLNGERLTSIAWGDQMPAFSKSADGEWLFVNHNGTQGWVATTWFKFVSGSLDTLPVAQ